MALKSNLSLSIWAPKEFGWSLNLYKLVVVPSFYEDYHGLVLPTRLAFVFFHWKILVTDSSSLSWKGVLGHLLGQGLWSQEEAHLFISILEHQAIRLSLLCWISLL